MFPSFTRWIQNFLAPAEYWHDPLNEKLYRDSSIFLADINNERGVNENYKTNLQQLKKFVMVKFTRDTIVQPMESEWFGFYKEGTIKEVYTLQESILFNEVGC